MRMSPTSVRIWVQGDRAVLHGGTAAPRGFDAIYPNAALSTAARHTRTEWLNWFLG